MGTVQGCPFVLHFTDPPSLLSRPRDYRASLWQRWNSTGAAFLTRRGARRAEKVITMTHRNAAELESVYGVKSLVIRQGGRPPPPWFTRDSSNSERPRLLSVCRLEESKRLDWIIEAVARLRDEHRLDIGLDLVGEGQDSGRLAALVRQYQVEQQVKLLGKIGDLELEQYFSAATIFVMPAVQGYGLPALEALYRQVPVVLHAESGVSEILGRTGWAEIFHGGPADLAQVILRMLTRVGSRNAGLGPAETWPTEAEWAEEISRQCGWLPASTKRFTDVGQGD